MNTLSNKNAARLPQVAAPGTLASRHIRAGKQCQCVTQVTKGRPKVTLLVSQRMCSASLPKFYSHAKALIHF
jgi:hypothetical protein